MELFTKLFGSWLAFTYHCFDRMVISGYLMGLQVGSPSRPPTCKRSATQSALPSN